MKKIIFRKPFISNEDKNLGRLYFDMAQHWLNTSEYAEEGDDKLMCLTNMSIYLDKAARKLGFINVEDMNEYYNRYRKF